MTTDLPHDPYMTAVAVALAEAGLEPTDWESLEPHDGFALDGVFRYTANHPAVDADAWPDGMQILWGAPDGWQWQEQTGDTLTDLPIDWCAAPGVVARTVRDVLAASNLTRDMNQWRHAAELEAAIDAWNTKGDQQ